MGKAEGRCGLLRGRTPEVKSQRIIIGINYLFLRIIEFLFLLEKKQNHKQIEFWSVI